MAKFRFSIFIILIFCVTFAFAAETSVNGARLVSTNPDETVLVFKVKDYDYKVVKTERGKALQLIVPNSTVMTKKGAPSLPKFSTSIIVPDSAKMAIEVIDSKYIEVNDVNIVPSKGVLSRTIDPATIAYQFGSEYDNNSFFPGNNLANLKSPYVARDFRGQSVVVRPFRYNPVTRVLRIYTKIKVRVYNTGRKGENALVRNQPLNNVYPEYKKVYSKQFINYDVLQAEYTPLGDAIGNMLIVSYSSFMDEMADFVSWKESIGYNVDLVNYSTIGSAAALKTYVSNYYGTNGLTFLLLVGDHAQVPASSTSAGYSDNNYGYISGSDHYLDIFVGRFSAETEAHVTTQADRTVYYERDLLASASWFNHAIGMASNEGEGGGHDGGESDETHVGNMLSDLSGYGYTNHQNYQDGGSVSNLSSLINAGAGIMLYTGHGSDTAWTCGWYFTTTNVNALTNEDELPFIFSVACVIGNFTSQTCFCETWLRATNNGNPTGAIAHAGSTINQDWLAPMTAQDEMVDVLAATGKRTFGGVFVNGMFQMLDEHGTSGANMADTWTCFGDPSVQLRTPGTPSGPVASTPDPPVAAFTSDKTSVMAGGSVSFTDQSTNNPTSWSWTFTGGTPSSSTAQNPTVTYSTAGNYTVTLVATNAAGNDTETKTNYITVTALQTPVAEFSANSTSVYVGQSVNFTDLSTSNPTSWAWTFNGGTPSSSTSQNPTITYNTVGTYSVTLQVTNGAGNDTETKTNYITVSEQPLSYCSTQGNSQRDEWIGDVQVGTFSNTSGASPYTDYTNLTAVVTAGNSVNVSLTTDYSGTTYTECWTIWIDYNMDGDFEDAGESVFTSTGTGTQTGSFTVASSAGGVKTRMRISMKYNSYSTPCETFSYGEVEDYTIDIQSAVAVPPVANFSASATTIDEGQSVNFTDLSTNNPTSWAWTFTGGTPSSSTAQNPSVTYNTAGTYTVSLTATNSAGNDVETKTAYITVEVPVITYCASSGGNQSYEWVAGVTVGSMNKTSGSAPYSDFTATTATLTAGGNVSVTLTPGFASSSYNEYWVIFIDYNGDGDFDDSGEQVFSGSGSSVVTGNFTVSSGASGTTRMRVVMSYNSGPTSCGSYTYGETEDYTVTFN